MDLYVKDLGKIQGKKREGSDQRNKRREREKETPRKFPTK